MPLILNTHHLPQLPDADTDVIVLFAAGGSTLGAWDGERWIDCTGMPLDQEDPSDRNRVIAWAEFPESPNTEPARPDLLERLSYHALERDDLSLDEVLDALAHGWKNTPGRTPRQMLFQLLGLMASAPATPQEPTR